MFKRVVWPKTRVILDFSVTCVQLIAACPFLGAGWDTSLFNFCAFNIWIQLTTAVVALLTSLRAFPSHLFLCHGPLVFSQIALCLHSGKVFLSGSEDSPTTSQHGPPARPDPVSGFCCPWLWLLLAVQWPMGPWRRKQKKNFELQGGSGTLKKATLHWCLFFRHGRYFQMVCSAFQMCLVAPLGEIYSILWCALVK